MAAPVNKDEELELDVESLAFGGNGVARLERLRRLRPPRPAGRPRSRARDESEALARRGARDRGRSARGPQRVEAPCAALPGVRRLPLPGSRVRRAARAEAVAGARRVPAARGDRRAAARGDRPVRARDLPLPQQDGVLVHARRRPARRSASTARGAGTRCSTSEKCWLTTDLGNGDPRRGARLGAGGRARGVLAGGRHRLSPASRRTRGAQHGPGARPARDRAGREVRARLLRRRRCGASRRCARCTGR